VGELTLPIFVQWMCNLYSLSKGQAAIIQFARVVRDENLNSRAARGLQRIAPMEPDSGMTNIRNNIADLRVENIP
jgi:hypothetical protein